MLCKLNILIEFIFFIQKYTGNKIILFQNIILIDEWIF